MKWKGGKQFIVDGTKPRSQVDMVMSPELPQPLGFGRCCQPFLTSLNIFGIPLWIKPPNRVRHWIIHLIGWLLYFVNVTSSLGSVFSESNPHTTHANINRSTAWQWNSAISRYNGMCSVIATQTTFLAVTAVRWKDLMEVLARIEKAKEFPTKEFQGINTIFKIGLSLNILSYTTIGLFALAVLTLDLKWWQLVIYGTQRIMILYMILAMISFCCFGLMAFSMLRVLGKDVDTSSVAESSVESVNRLIVRWNRCYLMIIDFNQQLNRCYGPLLLVLVAPTFVRIINTSFYLMMEFRNAGHFSIDGLVMLIILLANLLAFTFTVNIPYKIHEEAVNLTRKLRRLHFDDFFIQNKINVLTMEISNSLPKISAAGFFEVDLQLIPTLIGTTLTYLIILFQFQTSERF